jgi:glutamate-1-semialdehyde 2,1-aminomutase
MTTVEHLNERDQNLVATYLQGFFPQEVYDIHAHPYEPAHFGPVVTQKILPGLGKVGCAEHRAAMQRVMPVKTVHGLYFGYPNRDSDRAAVNAWVSQETKTQGTPLSRALLLVAPDDDRDAVAAELRSGRYVGLKVYHLFAPRPDTMNAPVEEYAPEWMWELLHETRGVLMLHIVRERAIADPVNQKALRRLCRAYPNMRLILAHVARSFNYRHAREGLQSMADLENVVIDTSAVAEAGAYQVALKILGPKRVLWGSDYFISESRGRCVATGQVFNWLSPDALSEAAKTSAHFTLVGIESLLCLREACEDAGLTAGDLEDIFRRNALRLLEPFLPKSAVPA